MTKRLAYSFEERWNKLVSMDQIRGLKIMEIAQYTILYFALSLLVARFLNVVYYDKIKMNREKEYKQRKRTIAGLFKLIFIICIELILLIIIMFYIRKVVLLVPSVGLLYNEHFKPHTTMHFIVEMALMFAFIEMMPEFRIQFERLGQWLI